MAESVASLDRLRRRLARLDAPRPRNAAGCFATGHDAVDAWLGGGLGRGRLHEVVADDAEAGSAAGFGAMLAGFAGAMVSPILSVEPGMGDNVLILAFVVIVIGGIGSIRGSFMAALLVGLVDTLGRFVAPPLLRGLRAPAAIDA